VEEKEVVVAVKVENVSRKTRLGGGVVGASVDPSSPSLYHRALT